MPLFCRHNRFEASCPICAKEKAPAVTPRARTARPAAARKPAAPRMRTRKLSRAADDGFRHDLAPGLKATADAERLAAALTVAAARIETQAPLAPEQAAELAFGDAAKVADWSPPADVPGWTPARRFERWFDRLRLPGATRGQRYRFLLALGFEPGALFFDVKGEDPTTLAAKRLLNSGDAMLLERRAAALADATGVPVGALDEALRLWESDDDLPEAEFSIRKALRL